MIGIELENNNYQIQNYINFVKKHGGKNKIK